MKRFTNVFTMITTFMQLAIGQTAVLLDDFEMRETSGDIVIKMPYTNQNALTVRGVTNAGSWYAYASNKNVDPIFGASVPAVV